MFPTVNFSQRSAHAHARFIIRAFDWSRSRKSNDLPAVKMLLIAVRGWMSTRPYGVSRLNFRPLQPLRQSRAGVDGRTIVLVAGNVGLAWPIIPRGRICLIYYIHCAIHRKRLPTLYCGRWKLEWDEGTTSFEKRRRREEGRKIVRDRQKGGFTKLTSGSF